MQEVTDRRANQKESTSDVGKTQKRPMCNGIYVKGTVQGKTTMFTADTGASKTIISSKLYQSLEESKKPSLRKSACLKGAGGSPIRELGQGEFVLNLGDLKLIHEAIVADIEDEALFGYDILGGGSDGPADLLLSKGKIVLEGVEIPCVRIDNSHKTREVTVAEDQSIPGRIEAVVDAYVERNEDDDFDSDPDYLIEPTDKFKERYQLKMESTLVSINRATTCNVRILNPFPMEVKLRQDAEIGIAEKIERVVSILLEKEHLDEEQNQTSVRRIQTSKPLETLNNSKLPTAKEKEVPDHLKDMFQRSTVGRNTYEKGVLAELLRKHAKTFSRHEWDLGLTNLTEHPINTGDATPIKQRPTTRH